MAITNTMNPNQSLATLATASSNSSDNSWFEAMAEAWGKALDNQAQKVVSLSDSIGDGSSNTPSQVSKLTAESSVMTFLSNSSHTAITSVGGALDTMARKQ
jgi:hypothetical protein